MKLKVTNITNPPREFGANALRGTIMVKPGETIEEEFSDNEAIGINGDTAIFKIEGFKQPKPTTQSDTGNGNSDAVIADLRNQLATVTAERDGLARRLADDANGSGSTEPMTLADAVASLDNANETHWIGSGKPSLEHLKHLTGNDALTRAEVDAFDVTRKA